MSGVEPPHIILSKNPYPLRLRLSADSSEILERRHGSLYIIGGCNKIAQRKQIEAYSCFRLLRAPSIRWLAPSEESGPAKLEVKGQGKFKLLGVDYRTAVNPFGKPPSSNRNFPIGFGRF